MRKQVCIVKSSDIDRLEEYINTVIGNMKPENIIDIQYQVEISSLDVTYHCAMIVYLDRIPE